MSTTSFSVVAAPQWGKIYQCPVPEDPPQDFLDNLPFPDDPDPDSAIPPPPPMPVLVETVRCIYFHLRGVSSISMFITHTYPQIHMMKPGGEWRPVVRTSRKGQARLVHLPGVDESLPPAGLPEIRGGGGPRGTPSGQAPPEPLSSGNSTFEKMQKTSLTYFGKKELDEMAPFQNEEPILFT